MTFAVLATTSSSISSGQPGLLGFLVVAGIGVALIFLLRSMNKQFRKITPDPSAAPGVADSDESVSDPSTPG